MNGLQSLWPRKAMVCSTDSVIHKALKHKILANTYTKKPVINTSDAFSVLIKKLISKYVFRTQKIFVKKKLNCFLEIR